MTNDLFKHKVVCDNWDWASDGKLIRIALEICRGNDVVPVEGGVLEHRFEMTELGQEKKRIHRRR